MTMNDFLRYLDDCDCPSPPRLALELLDLLDRPEVSVRDIAERVRRDPILAAKTLKLANSALYRGLRPVVAIEDAVMRIGLAVLARLAIGLSLTQQRPVLSRFLDLPRYWSAALVRATAMQALARAVGSWSPPELFTIGLLAEIGTLILACAAPEPYGRILKNSNDLVERLEKEQTEFGFDHRQLSAALLVRWGLPGFMAEAVSSDNTGASSHVVRSQELRAMLNIARWFGDYADGSCAENAPPPERLLAKLGQHDDLMDRIRTEIEGEWQDLSDLFDLDPPADVRSRLQQLTHPEALPLVGSARDACRTVRVLVVDDDGDSRALLRRILEPAGYEVLEATDAESAMELMQQFLPRVLILDWVLPGMDGPSLCQCLRQKFGGRLYILVFSAIMDGGHAVEALDAGANDFLEKPVSRKFLLAKLKNARAAVELTQSLEDIQYQSRESQRELLLLNEALRQVAAHDDLTGLHNRRSIDQYLKEAWETALRYGSRLAVIMLDVDHFKRVNDEHGHDAGDRALCALAKVLKEHVRSSDRVARWGGEEFVIVCSNSGAEEAQQLAERLRSAAEGLNGDFPSITLSGGVAERVPEMSSPDDLLRAADQALLHAKRDGRNRIILHDKGGSI
ncbi:diguanylate cyclase [Acidithiobacillus sp. CV18-2]|uniref:diguanylate cyclase n=1 Tax=Igneacidithiobacillus copahuensis TaxID=2724909 RepID=A0AAE2YRI9_9PROT|nr:diguanylate cyclase [Igneacidithiobacillus copahuensis]MBU2753167.1 diguanylate cyclase [Acidithiobacillus sp. CV18-3]MBU2757718.1 diguanylate cyclase [Acidithiobacillus sp. BN09-2]MBU2778318.1 diguanylate cyclase [Acidithiobacillus sp. CV18-2]MBU2795816.1 diguanylate cyclase [Acidithiobacillus sp. VAN18-2]MBU2799962.1 diguanylate cyclase [Acidithiobacillus sp. VAN18-4]UTV80182.1 diguanylate cyclase [Acidithiobacillus sp. YTS05]